MAETKRTAKRLPPARPDKQPAKQPEKQSQKREEKNVGASAIEKAFAALEAIAELDESPSLSQLAVRLGVPKASAHRIMTQLEQAGLLQRDLSGKRLRIGPRMARIALRAIGATNQPEIHAAMERLVQRIGESCNLGALQGTRIVYLDRVECDWPLRTHFRAGSQVPLHCTATGKLFLAFMDEPTREDILRSLTLERHTEKTIVDPKKLRAELARIRAAGYAENDQEFMVGLIGLSVPVLDARGRLLAGLAIHAPIARLSIVQSTAHLASLREAAAVIAKVSGA
ncbi:MAG: sauR [Rhodospirillales bacterium]|nr:sauR [Rhodospirillales bacterium]